MADTTTAGGLRAGTADGDPDLMVRVDPRPPAAVGRAARTVEGVDDDPQDSAGLGRGA